MHANSRLQGELVAELQAVARAISTRKELTPELLRLSAVVSRIPLVHLERWERRVRDEFAIALRENAPKKWKFWARSERAPLWIDLASANGYTREEALLSLSDVPDRFVFALVVRRLNDWVPQIRATAKRVFVDVASKAQPEDVVDVLCAVLPLWTSWGRLDDADRGLLLKAASIEPVAGLLASRILAAATGPMTTILRQVGRSDLLDSRLTEFAEQAIQPSVRAEAYRSLLERKATWLRGREWRWTDKRYCKGGYFPVHSERKLECESPFVETLTQAAADRSPIVRRVAAEVLVSNLDDDRLAAGDLAKELAGKLAADESPSVAYRGAFAVRKLDR